MKIEYQILIILFIHWIADFVFQTDSQAKGKSTSNKWLLLHTLNYSLIWLVFGVLLISWDFINFSYENLGIFIFITFWTHTITDYFTSRLNSKLWKKGDTHNFFVSIGFDQFLHFTQLILTYTLLK